MDGTETERRVANNLAEYAIVMYKLTKPKRE